MPNNDYYNWGLHQHPAPMIYQMEKQIKEGQAFVSTFKWERHFWNPKKKSFLAQSVKVYDSGESFWIFIKGKKEIKIKMWDGEQIIDPRPFLTIFAKKESLKQKCKKLQILKKAYKGTDKLGAILEEIEEIESTYHLGIDEIIFKK